LSAGTEEQEVGSKRVRWWESMRMLCWA